MAREQTTYFRNSKSSRKLARTLVPAVAAAAILIGVAPAFAQDATKRASPDSGLAKRVQQLEEQLVDMQVVIGTLETLARSQGAASAPMAAPAFDGGVGAGGVDAGRLSSMETQISALTNQVQQLSRQIQAMGQQPGAAGAPQGQVGQWSESPRAAAGAPAVDAFDTSIGTDAGSAGQWSASGQVDVPASPGNVAGGQQVSAVDAKNLYETAYGYLLQQDYGAAETAFSDFLTRYPTDRLAGNAQFWLGESYFVRRQYKAAARAFLKGYENYGKSAKAPDSLLKLAMSLHRLGQKQEACSTIAELNSRFPQATDLVRSRASAERQRMGC